MAKKKSMAKPSIPKFGDFTNNLHAFCSFLRWHTIEVDGLPTTQFIPYDGEIGREFRRQFSLALRDHTAPIPMEVRKCLADLFDPEPDFPSSVREIKIAFRKKGNSKDHIRNSAIATAVMKEIRKGHGVNEAIEILAMKLGLDITTIMKIWSSYRAYRDAGLL